MGQIQISLKAWVFLFFWLVLILAGIIAKRVYGHPDLIIFYHLPAAFCLVIAFYDLTKEFRKKYREALVRNRNRTPYKG